MAAGRNPKRSKTDKPKTRCTRNDHAQPQQQQQIDDEEEEDIPLSLIDLPDNILHYILSILNSKSIIRTSVLSKQWRSFVESLPYHLNFNESTFTRHVEELLSRRNRSAGPVRSVTFAFVPKAKSSTEMMTAFDGVMQYAARDGKLDCLCVTYDKGKFGNIADSVALCGRTIQTLVLNRFILDRDKEFRCLGLTALTTLELRSCFMFNVVPGNPNRANYPLDWLPAGLKRLKMVDCTSSGRLRVWAPQLVDLEIKSLLCKGVDVFAPKLESFRLWCNVLDLEKLPSSSSSGLDFPRLDRADVRLWCDDPCRLDDWRTLDGVGRAYMKLLRSLCSAGSFTLRFDKLASGKSWKEHNSLFRDRP